LAKDLPLSRFPEGTWIDLRTLIDPAADYCDTLQIDRAVRGHLRFQFASHGLHYRTLNSFFPTTIATPCRPPDINRSRDSMEYPLAGFGPDGRNSTGSKYGKYCLLNDLLEERRRSAWRIPQQ